MKDVLKRGALILTALLIVSISIFAAPPQVVRTVNTTYYMDCAGNDSNNGTSTATAWKTMARASQQSYGPSVYPGLLVSFIQSQKEVRHESPS